MPPPFKLENKPDISGSPSDKKATKNLWVYSIWILLGGVSSLFISLNAANKSRIQDLKVVIADYKEAVRIKDSIIRIQAELYNKKMDEWRESLQAIEQKAANKNVNP